MKRKIAGVLVLILSMTSILSFAGCSKEQKLNDVKTEDSSAVVTGETLKLITWTNDSTIEALNKINEQFLADTGIKVEITSVEATEYENFLQNKMVANDTDIFCYTTDSKAFAQPMVDWAPSDMLTWEKIISEGYALDISKYDFISNWSTGAEACRYKDGIYGIATGMTIMNGLFYNKKMFEENDWHEPRTWNEFVTLCEKIKAAGIAPITVGGKDTWPVQMITNAIVDTVEEGTGDELTKGLWLGTRKFTDEKSMEIYNREKLVLTYMEDDFLSVEYDEAPKRFAAGKAAMLYDGSWNAFEIEKANPDFEYDYFAIPGDTRHSFTGKYDLTFGINAKSDKVDEAVKWLEYFSNPDVYKIYIDCNGFVPTMSWISTSNTFLVMIDDRLKDAGRTYECFNRVPTNMGTHGTFDLINYSIAGGDFDTPEEFAKAAQEEWEEAMKDAAKE